MELISSNYYPQMLEQAMIHFGVDMDQPFSDLSQEEKDLVLYGSNGKEFHFHYEMNLVEFGISRFLLKGRKQYSPSFP